MDVYCFDFDGVICDSAPETALAAWNACAALWPADGAPLPEALQQRFCRLRPVLHTGYEAVALMRLIKDGEVDDEAVLSDFAALRDAFIEREGLTPHRLKQLFGDARDKLIEQDRSAWLCWNRFYPGIGDVLSEALRNHEVFIVTTKQERFVALLLEHNRIKLSMERVFGLEQNKTKPEILSELMERPESARAALHFIEDRMGTLRQVAATPELEPVRLYLVDWGYNTAAQREEARASDRITVVSMEDLLGMQGI
ncbi:MAG: HAD hydrolase-like protein [SAR324 cluster bacterium]|nr:HAD hydrolase-like protein [SAR324 cluster bacterium]